MAIRFLCFSCEARIKVPDGTQGRKVKCPACGSLQRVPESSDTPPERISQPASPETPAPAAAPPPATEASDAPPSQDDAGQVHDEPAADETDSHGPADALASLAMATSTPPEPSEVPQIPESSPESSPEFSPEDEAIELASPSDETSPPEAPEASQDPESLETSAAAEAPEVAEVSASSEPPAPVEVAVPQPAEVSPQPYEIASEEAPSLAADPPSPPQTEPETAASSPASDASEEGPSLPWQEVDGQAEGDAQSRAAADLQSSEEASGEAEGEAPPSQEKLDPRPSRPEAPRAIPLGHASSFRATMARPQPVPQVSSQGDEPSQPRQHHLAQGNLIPEEETASSETLSSEASPSMDDSADASSAALAAAAFTAGAGAAGAATMAGQPPVAQAVGYPSARPASTPRGVYRTLQGLTLTLRIAAGLLLLLTIMQGMSWQRGAVYEAIPGRGYVLIYLLQVSIPLAMCIMTLAMAQALAALRELLRR